jgi:hypothetical protein
VAHPLATFTQKLKVSGSHFEVAKKAFVLQAGMRRTHSRNLQMKSAHSAGP